MPAPQIFDVAVEKTAETALAWLLNDGANEDWFPKSQCELEEKEDGSCILSAPIWLLKKKGFI